MNIKLIADYFEGRTSDIDFSKELLSDLESRVGSQVQRIFVDGNSELRVSAVALVKLMDLYLSQKLDERGLEYICDILDMYNKVIFDEESLRDVVFMLSEPEINYPITRELVESIKLWLTSNRRGGFSFDGRSQ